MKKIILSFNTLLLLLFVYLYLFELPNRKANILAENTFGKCNEGCNYSYGEAIDTKEYPNGAVICPAECPKCQAGVESSSGINYEICTSEDYVPEISDLGGKEFAESLNNNFSFPSISFPSSVILEESCERKAEEGNSRPTACYLCTESNLTPSCASSFKVFDEVEYLKTGGDPIEKDWGGDIIVDPREIKIPFVGKGGEENEINYLADYLEGTNEYYGNYENQVIITNYQGILRKLTPFEYQNSLKKKMVEKAKNKEVNDYKVRYIGRLCWDAPLWASGLKFVIDKFGLSKLTPDINHFCVYEKFSENPVQWLIVKFYRLFDFLTPELADQILDLPGMFHVSYVTGVELTSISTLEPPPNPNDFLPENYQKKFLEWKYINGKDGDLTDAAKLWSTASMLSREDSKGEIDPYLAPENEKDAFLPEEPGIEAVPHVARLYEGSQIIHQTLTPADKEIEMFTSEQTKTIPPNTCFTEKYIPTDSGDQLCCDPVTKTLVAWEKFDNPSCIDDPLTSENECKEKVDVSREFGVALQHPYLDEIWSYTTYANSAGFFNIFRPYQKEQFEDVAAAATVSYGYNPEGLFNIRGEISPKEGQFLFPHLGGIQTAKEETVNKTLWPCYKNSPWPCK